MDGHTWPDGGVASDQTMSSNEQSRGDSHAFHPVEGAWHSPAGQKTYHQRHYTEEIPRLHPKPTRARSSTALLQNFSTPLQHRPGLEPDNRRPTSVFAHARNESSGSFTRTLKSKASRLLRRQGSAGDLTSLKPRDWSDELDSTPWESPPVSPERQSRKLTKPVVLKDADESPLRPNISLPFDFRQLNLTNGDRFERIHHIPVQRAGSSGSASQYSQSAPEESQGAGARTVSAQSYIGSKSPPMSTPGSRPTTPRRPSDTRPSPRIPPRPENPWGDEPIRRVPSTDFQRDNLSRISTTQRVSRLQSPPENTLDTNVDTRSSYHATASPKVASPDIEKSGSPSPWPLEVNPLETPTSPDSANHETSTRDSGGEIPDLKTPHAVTSPDDTAYVLRPPPFEGTILSRVLEEDEISDRSSSVITMRRLSSVAESTPQQAKHLSGFIQTPGHHSRSGSAESYRQSIQLSPRKQRKAVNINESPFDDAEIPESPRPVSNSGTEDGSIFSNAYRAIEDCYKLNAEADSNFDFARAVSPGPDHNSSGSGDDAAPNSSPGRRTSSVYSASPPLLPKLETSAVPDLEPASAISTQSSFETEITTPDSSTPSRGLSFAPKPLNFARINSQHSFHVTSEQTSPGLYESLCREDFTRESWNYGRADGSTISNCTSNRSSRAPISTSSSLESFPMRRSSGRRSKDNNSQGSLPELLSSRYSRGVAGAERATVWSSSLPAPAVAAANERPESPLSLVRDAAHKSLLLRIKAGQAIDDACSAETPLPEHPANRAG